MADSCEHDNEPSDFIKGGISLGNLSNCQLLKRYSENFIIDDHLKQGIYLKVILKCILRGDSQKL